MSDERKAACSSFITHHSSLIITFMRKSDKELAFLHDLYVETDWGERFAELIDEHVVLPREGRALYVGSGTGAREGRVGRGRGRRFPPRAARSAGLRGRAVRPRRRRRLARRAGAFARGARRDGARGRAGRDRLAEL